MTITMCHLYPDLLNQNGDRGNITALMQRCRWRGIPVRLREIKKHQPLDLTGCDLLFIGGGTLQGKALARQALTPWREPICTAVEQNLVLLAIGEGFQLLGRYCQSATGEKNRGLGILNIHTEYQETRISGPVAVEVTCGDQKTILAGFENHSGKTFLNGNTPLGTVQHGHGNNGQDQTEGARYKNVFGTYLQGPLLPYNPILADYLIRLILQQKNQPTGLMPLDDTLEQQAYRGFSRR